MIEIKKNINRITTCDVEEFEAKIDLTLPEEYKNFLLKFNGGIPEKNRVKSKYQDDLVFQITEFFGIGVKEDLFLNAEAYSDRLPSKCIAIASIEGGNLLCLNLAQENYGSLYFWDHEEVSEVDISISELNEVSHSFKDFLTLIEKHTTAEDAFEGYTVVKGWINPEFLKKK